MTEMGQLKELVEQMWHSSQQELIAIIARQRTKSWEERCAYLAKLDGDQMLCEEDEVSSGSSQK